MLQKKQFTSFKKTVRYLLGKGFRKKGESVNSHLFM